MESVNWQHIQVKLSASMCALHGVLGKRGYDVQVCVTGRGERCERTSEDHGVTFAGWSLLPFDLLVPLPPGSLTVPIPLVPDMPSARCFGTSHTA